MIKGRHQIIAKLKENMWTDVAGAKAGNKAKLHANKA